MSSQQKDLVYALGQDVPKLVYAFWTCKPVPQGAFIGKRAIPGTTLIRGYTFSKGMAAFPLACSTAYIGLYK